MSTLHVAGAYAPAITDFIASLPWTFFITYPVVKSQLPDEEVNRRWKLIEAHLCGRYLPNRWHKIEGDGRFHTLIAFEGMRSTATRHAHLLMHVPESIFPTRFRHHFLLSLRAEIQMLWNQFSPRHQQLMVFGNKQNCWQEYHPWESPSGTYSFVNRDFLQIGMAEPEAAATYTMKSQSAEDREWSGWNFVTPAKYIKFRNLNTKAIRKQDRKARQNLGL